jgi:hypothetical protein
MANLCNLQRSSASLLIPSRSWLHRLGAAAMRSSLVLPSILTRMEQFVRRTEDRTIAATLTPATS